MSRGNAAIKAQNPSYKQESPWFIANWQVICCLATLQTRRQDIWRKQPAASLAAVSLYGCCPGLP